MRQQLSVTKCRQFVEYLELVGSECFAKLIEVRRCSAPDAEAVIFEVDVERPQVLAHDIRGVETLAALFQADDGGYPIVLALRGEFPLVPHLNFRREEFPRSLCLYDQPWENIRLTWTPATFLQRIQMWLAKTANGTLHPNDQTLEPLIFGSNLHLIVPADFNALARNDQPQLLDVTLGPEHAGQQTFFAEWPQDGTRKVHSIAATFTSPTQTHGVISHIPGTLGELDDLCQRAGLPLVDRLTETLRGWFVSKPIPNVLKARLLIVLALPKARQAGGPIESVETRAFFTLKTLEELGVLLGILDKNSGVAGGVAGYIIGSPACDAQKLGAVPLALLQVYHALSAKTAALMNGIETELAQFVAVGMGALGSQVLNNCLRAGFGRWTIVDPDTLLPHNGARHLLAAPMVGWNKAEAMAAMTNEILDGEPAVTPIPADVLRPVEHAEALNKAMAEASLVLDLSASVAVARHLARSEVTARHASVFLTPRGDGLVVGFEDASRSVRLDWLEMLHYRAVLNEPDLHDSLQSVEGKHRYGNACRDVTTQLAQDDVAIWAGTASKEVKRARKNEGATLRIFRARADGSTQIFEPTIAEFFTLTLADWTIRFDRWLLGRLVQLRQEKLPNETGGILLGSFDTQARFCSIIDVVPSPPDSTEWPTSYIRGFSGLRERVQEVEAFSLGQIGYVGEWHSHPEGYSTNPSNDDRTAYTWLIGHMHAEALPAIMLIVGDDGAFRLVSTEPG